MAAQTGNAAQYQEICRYSFSVLRLYRKTPLNDSVRFDNEVTLFHPKELQYRSLGLNAILVIKTQDLEQQRPRALCVRDCDKVAAARFPLAGSPDSAFLA
jgi:hypothetical protein